MEITQKLVDYFIKSGFVIEACDLLMEVDRLDLVSSFVEENNIRRVYDYLVSCSPFSTDTDEYLTVLKTAYEISLKQKEYPFALRVALKLDNQELIERAFNECEDVLVKKQLAFALGRQRIQVETEDEELTRLMSNTMLSEYYKKLCVDLDVTKPKKPEEIYKQQFEEGNNEGKLESAQANLADTYVNAFVNIGTGKDTLMQEKEPWIANVKKEGILAATASLGLIYLWDVEGCEEAIADYLDLKDGYAKAGACIGIGISNSGIWSEMDPAKALLEEYLESDNNTVKMGSAIGLGLAYAGTAREDLQEILCPIVLDEDVGVETAAFAAVSLGLIYVSRCDEEVVNTILTSLMSRSEVELNQPIARFFAVGLALTYLGQQEKCEPAIETLMAVEHPISEYAQVCVQAAAYIGSGNVLKIQEFLKLATPHEKTQSKAEAQMMAVIGIAMIAISEEVGNSMASRAMNNFLQYSELNVKR